MYKDVKFQGREKELLAEICQKYLKIVHARINKKDTAGLGSRRDCLILHAWSSSKRYGSFQRRPRVEETLNTKLLEYAAKEHEAKMRISEIERNIWSYQRELALVELKEKGRNPETRERRKYFEEDDAKK